MIWRVVDRGMTRCRWELHPPLQATVMPRKLQIPRDMWRGNFTTQFLINAGPLNFDFHLLIIREQRRINRIRHLIFDFVAATDLLAYFITPIYICL